LVFKHSFEELLIDRFFDIISPFEEWNFLFLSILIESHGVNHGYHVQMRTVKLY